MSRIRNFCIIAHIDHGKSTLADRLIQHCGAVDQRKFRDQILDSMDIERERGITIKSNTITLDYTALDGETLPAEPDRHPGPRRFLARGAALADVLRRGAAAGRRLAGRRGPDRGQPLSGPRVRPRAHPGDQQDRPALGRRRARASRRSSRTWGSIRPRPSSCSAKDGRGHPRRARGDRAARCRRASGDPAAPLRALLFDAQLRRLPRRGAVLPRHARARCAPGQRLRLMHTRQGAQGRGGRPAAASSACPTPELGAGDVGYVIAGIKTVRDIDVGDTLTDAERPAAEPLPGYKEAKPVVFSSIYPMATDEYQELAQGARQARAQRRLADLREGLVGRAGPRLPLRLPRPAAPRDRAGAPGARVRPVAAALRAVGALPRHAGERRGACGSTTPATTPTRR